MATNGLSQSFSPTTPVARSRLLCGALSIPFLISSDLIDSPFRCGGPKNEDPRVSPGVV